MATARVEHVRFRGVVGAVPGPHQSIFDLPHTMDPAEVQKMAQTVGLDRLYRAGEGQTAGDLCTAAAEQLLSDLGWDRGSVDGLIMVTQTPDHISPATACVVHGKLGLSQTCATFDIGMGCSGYVYGLFIASQMIAAGMCRRVLLLAGDTLSPILSPEDRSVALLFGDAGSATALEYDPTAPSMAFVFGTDGTGASYLGVPAGAFRLRPTTERSTRVTDEEGNRRSPMELYMDGLSVFNFTLKRVPPLVRETEEVAGWPASSADKYVFHQANGFILSKIAKKLGVDPARVPVNIGKYGNTSMTSIPLVLADDMAEAVRKDAPLRVVLAGFGVGLSWAGAGVTLSDVGAACVITV